MLGWAGSATAQTVDASNVHGAVYVPFGVYNAPQMWKNFSPAETRRDFGYARELHVNTVRMWASYEYWQQQPEDFTKKFDQMLEEAHRAGIRVLISLFENDGALPTPERMADFNPRTTGAIQSPGPALVSPGNKQAWDKPAEFVTWFMKRYGSDSRLIAIELMNEPSDTPRAHAMDFAKAMLVKAASLRGTVPLTVGTDKLDKAVQFLPLGSNILQIHDNFPPSLEELHHVIEAALAVGKEKGVPVWIGEWQRVRPGGSGWGNKPVAPDQLYINYASMANELRKYSIGTFFWSLMVKGAYLKNQRDKGTVSGLFWPSGAVWSLKDARAVANDPKLQLNEKPLPPNFLDSGKEPK